MREASEPAAFEFKFGSPPGHPAIRPLLLLPFHSQFPIRSQQQMGCVSSAFLEEGEEHRGRIISHHHHVVSLTSSTYGILASPRAYSSSASLAKSPPPAATSAPHPPPPPPPPPPQLQPPPPPEPPEVINSWELMAGLLDPSTPAKPPTSTPRRRVPVPSSAPAVVLYTTSLRGVRATFEACNAVRSALQAHGVAFRERDVSMDRGFREELREALLARGLRQLQLPRLVVRGRHVGGAEEVRRLEEQGLLGPLLEGLPRARGGTYGCDGCGGVRFLPCFDCSGSRKVPVPLAGKAGPGPPRRRRAMVLVRCGECNENGLVLCPICS